MLRDASGFTLIEMLLAMGILAIILVMIAGSFATVAHGKIHAESRLASNQAGDTIIWQMSQEFRDVVGTGLVPNSVMPPANMLLVGAANMQSGTPLDGLTISTLGAGHTRSLFGYGSENVVTYSIAPNPNHRGWYLLSRTQQSGLIPIGAGAKPQPVVLADNLLSLHIRYYNGNIWNESWNSNTPGTFPLPFSVSIDLQLAASNGSPINFSTQVAIPAAQILR
jgi:prepilin-type N-terminal cleavage/methylation domain-containing protein